VDGNPIACKETAAVGEHLALAVPQDQDGLEDAVFLPDDIVWVP